MVIVRDIVSWGSRIVRLGKSGSEYATPDVDDDNHASVSR